MKIFFISDIHGNQFALERILIHAKQIGSDLIYCCGDLSGYFTGVNEIIELLKQYKVKSILGNHDAFLLGLLPISKEKPYYTAWLKTKDIVSSSSYNWLKKLNATSKYTSGNTNIELYHGGPKDLYNQYIYPSSLNNFMDFFKNSNVFVFGHTHLQFAINLSNKLFINPGSVGLPRNGDYRAHGISFNTNNNELIDHRIDYDIVPALQKYQNDKFINPIFLHNIHFGRSSKKRLKNNHSLFLLKNTVNALKETSIKAINTKFGAILSVNNNSPYNNLLYVASYEDDTVEITSSTLHFSWKNAFVSKTVNDELLWDNLVENSAGIYYRKIYQNKKLFNYNALEDIENAFQLLGKYQIQNVKT
ncbi:MAG: phosphodiesterase, family [Mucilaginibacter sp.]|nr:phosphodiesterase, family [Mucilaginibacter sp.]